MPAAKVARGSSKQCKSEKIITFTVLLVFMTFFVHNSEELSFFGFGGKQDEDVQSAIVDKMLAKKHTITKKYKFHKLERLETDNDGDGDDDGDDGDDNDTDIVDDEDIDNGKDTDDEDNNDVNEGDSDDGDNDDGNDDGDNSVGIKAHTKRSKFTYKNIHETKDDESQDDEDDDDDDGKEEIYQFRKARTARKPVKLGNKKVHRDDQRDLKSMLNSLLNGWFKKDDHNDNDNEEDDGDEDGTVFQEKTNSIIDWLMWLGDKLPKFTQESEEEGDDDNTNRESWLDYLNRWPFNSLFPIGKPGKPIKMPKIPSKWSSKRPSSDLNDDADEDNGDDDDEDDDESEEYSLPLFTVTLNDEIVEEAECRQQLETFHQHLSERKLWTLQMLDATAKLSTGLLRGNINQFGDSSMCTDIKATAKLTNSEQQQHSVRIRGKYCLAHIEVQASAPEFRLPVYLFHGRGLLKGHLGNPSHFIPRYGVANVGVCVPQLCSAAVVQRTLISRLEAYNSTGIEIHVEIEDNDCYVKQIKSFLKIMRKDKKFCATLLYFLGLILLLIATTAREYWSYMKVLTDKITIVVGWLKRIGIKLVRKPNKESEESGEQIQETLSNVSAPQENIDEEEKKEEYCTSEQQSLGEVAVQVLKSFSATTTYRTLFSPNLYDVPFSCLPTLKLAALFMLYVSMKFLMLGHLPIVNGDEVVRSFEQSWTILLRNPLIYSDTLLLISGFLAGYQLSEEMEEKSHIHLLRRVSLKVSRFIPTVHLLICFQTWILPHLNAAPLWTNIIGQNARLCEEQWWRNIFSIQNAIDFEETCSPATVQLALEMQLYILGPLIVWLYYKNSDVGFFTYGALHAFSIAARYSYTRREHLSMTLFHGINVSKLFRTANHLYASPVSRATPYLLGVGAGILQKTHHGIFDLTPELERIGWILSSLGLCWCFWSPSNGMHAAYVYNSSDAASYASWCPLIFGLSVFWFLFMLPRHGGRFIQWIATSQTILVLSRLIFPLQLVMYLTVLYNTASVSEPTKFHITNLVNVPEIIFIILGAFIVAFLIDVPNQKVCHLLINRVFNERSSEENDNAEGEAGSGAEMSDASEEPLDHAVEPVESIWPSDPEEEEEQRFLTRRASLLNHPKTFEHIDNATDLKKTNEENQVENEAVQKEEKEDEDEEEEEEE